MNAAAIKPHCVIEMSSQEVCWSLITLPSCQSLDQCQYRPPPDYLQLQAQHLYPLVLVLTVLLQTRRPNFRLGKYPMSIDHEF